MFGWKLKNQALWAKIKHRKNKEKTAQQVRDTSIFTLMTTSILKLLVLCFFGLIIIMPFAFMILVAAMPDIQAETLVSSFTLIPKEWEINTNLTRAYNSEYWNSVLLTFVNVLFSIVFKIIVTMLAGYAFSLKKWWGKELIWWIFIALLVLPEVALLTGQYKVVVLLDEISIRKSFLGVVSVISLPFMASIFNALMFRNAFEAIPKRIKEVSIIDGATGWKYLFKIAMPMVMPTTLTIVILTALASWNSYLWPALVAGSDYKIMSVWLFDAGRDVNAEESDRILQNVKMAGSIVAILPMFIFYFLFRKRIMSSISRQGSTIKG